MKTDEESKFDETSLLKALTAQKSDNISLMLEQGYEFNNEDFSLINGLDVISPLMVPAH